MCVCTRAHACVRVRVHARGRSRHLRLQNRNTQSGHKHDFIVLGIDSQVYFCAPLAGNTPKEIQVSRVHSHRWAFAGPDTHGGEVSEPLTLVCPGF